MEKSNTVKTAVITGGSQGIGAELVKLYKSAGYKVYSLSRSNPDNLQNFIECDVAIESDVARAFAAISADRNKIDLLVNNAGIGLNGAVELIKPESAEKCMDVNFMGAYYCIRHALPLMKEAGRIINVSSAAALFALPFKEFYCASKASLNMLTFGLRMELSATKIQAGCVCPGDTKSGFNKNRIREYETNERYGDRMKRAAQRLDKKEEKRMPCGEVAKKIFKAAEKKKIKPMTIIGGKYKVIYFFYKLLPLSLFLKLTNKFFG